MKEADTHTMELILKKFPIQENIDWSKLLSKAEDTVKEKQFSKFMRWLEEAGASWKLLAAQGTGASSGGMDSLFGGHETGHGQGDNSCYGCRETGN